MDSAENHTTKSDVDLMREIVQGDETALSELYDRYGSIVFAVCMRSLKDRNESEEVTSRVFWELWDRCERFDPNRGNVQAYVLTIARSRALDQLRSRNSKSQLNSQVHLDEVPMLNAKGFDPSDEMLIDEWRVHVNRALAGLDDSQRQAIELAFYEGLTHREVAARLNKPLGTVKAHIRKGLMKLRQCLVEFEKGHSL